MSKCAYSLAILGSDLYFKPVFVSKCTEMIIWIMKQVLDGIMRLVDSPQEHQYKRIAYTTRIGAPKATQD